MSDSLPDLTFPRTATAARHALRITAVSHWVRCLFPWRSTLLRRNRRQLRTAIHRRRGMSGHVMGIEALECRSLLSASSAVALSNVNDLTSPAAASPYAPDVLLIGYTTAVLPSNVARFLETFGEEDPAAGSVPTSKGSFTLPTAMSAVQRSPGALAADSFTDTGVLTITRWVLPAGTDVRAAANAVSTFFGIAFSEPDFIAPPNFVPNDPSFGNQYHHAL
ncbi:MAG: hypothetical protein KF861_23610, partial [Planctomycetaceae bacterium]|nr:hypothetical protein [Planctomycetaceae bacterium]